MDDRDDGVPAPRLSPGEYCAALDAEIARFVKVVETADPAAPVPTCPGWTMARLAKHLGITHRWVEHIVRNALPERIPQRDVPADLPADDAGWPAWLADGGARLVGTLGGADPEAPVWTLPGMGRAAFWPRRMLHETTVHRADAELALGAEPEITPDVAADGLEEYLDILARVERVAVLQRELGGAGETIHLHATDIDGEWLITLGPGGTTWRRGHAKGTVAVRGTARDLLLLAYDRIAAGPRHTVYGDGDLLRRWLEKSGF
jgi:uncharacterized protein (TIGR03083 family)